MKKPVAFVASHLMVVSAAKWAGRRADYQFQLVAGTRCSPPVVSWGIFTAEHTMVIFLVSSHEVDNVFFDERMTLNGKRCRSGCKRSCDLFQGHLAHHCIAVRAVSHSLCWYWVFVSKFC